MPNRDSYSPGEWGGYEMIKENNGKPSPKLKLSEC